MRVKVFCPRSKEPLQLEVVAGETIGALRGRVAQQVGGGATSVLLLAGQKVRDPEYALRLEPRSPRAWSNASDARSSRMVTRR